MTASARGDDLVTVRILGLPPLLARQSRAWFDELSREFLHLAHSDEAVRKDVPGRLLALSDELRARFSTFTDSNTELAEEAAERGEDAIDLVFHVPAVAGPAAAELASLLDEAERYCAAGEHLLTLAAPPEVLAYRQWYVGQFVEQINGAPPVPFAEWCQVRG